MIIKNADVYTQDNVFVKGDVVVDNGTFTKVLEAPDYVDNEVVDATGLKMIPGLVDIHFHGCKGADMCDGTKEALDIISRDLRFGEFARFSKGERQTGGANRDSILCDMFESVLGAIYLDGGMECATAYLSGIFPAYVLFAFDGPSFSLWSSTTVSGVYPRSSCGVYTSNGLIELPG